MQDFEANVALDKERKDVPERVVLKSDVASFLYEGAPGEKQSLDGTKDDKASEVSSDIQGPRDTSATAFVNRKKLARHDRWATWFPPSMRGPALRSGAFVKLSATKTSQSIQVDG